MEQLFTNLVNLVLGGGPASVAALLLIAVGGLVWERKRLIAELSKKDQKIDKIIDDYYEGNINLTEALNNLKTVLVEIKGRLD